MWSYNLEHVTFPSKVSDADWLQNTIYDYSKYIQNILMKSKSISNANTRCSLFPQVINMKILTHFSTISNRIYLIFSTSSSFVVLSCFKYFFDDRHNLHIRVFIHSVTVYLLFIYILCILNSTNQLFFLVHSLHTYFCRLLGDDKLDDRWNDFNLKYIFV